MTNNSDEQHTQAFQSRSTVGILHIPTMMDSRSGQRIVPWDDIQDGFENAKCIRNGGTLVPFLKDEDFKRVMPWRIAHHPGVVLEVVEGANSQGTSMEAANLADQESSYHSHDLSSKLYPECTTDTRSLVREVILSIADTNTDHYALVKHSRGIPEESQSSLHAYNQLYNSYFEAIVSGQAIQAARIKQSMDQHFERLQIEMDKNKVLQEQIISMQQEMQQLQQQTREELLDKQKQMQQLQQRTKEELLAKQKSLDEKQGRILQMQQEALNRLAIIQNRVQALLIQTYELHEYPIPRLFIVLPKATGLRDKLKKPFAHQFRLYFLCECGTHTTPDDCKTQHEIHLAKHDGYDLDKPTEFFEKYGTYLLALMYMIKYGIVAAGLIVPPLANFKIADELILGQKHIEYLKKNIAPLVDGTINYLQEIKRNTEAGAELTTDCAEFDKLEALEGADLRQLESYLKDKDQGRVLGNLYRIVTLEGHVKWVCFDHYRTNCQETTMQQLQDIVQVNDGKFIEEIGRIEIKMATGIQAKQLYDALIKSRGIQELEIALEWDVTMDDLRALARAVTMANVIRLTVDGTLFKGRALDIANRSRRFDPIVQLVFNARVQSLHLKGFDDFFSRVSNPALGPASKFRVFSMDSKISSKDKHIKYYDDFLDCCPSLTTLELKFQKQWPVTKVTSDILRKLPKLESLKVDRGNFSFTASVSDGKIQNMAMTTERLSDLGLEGLSFIRQNGLTSLSVEYTRVADDVQLVDILRQSPGLNTLRIGCHEAHCLAIVDLVVSTRTTLLQGGGSSQLRTFELMEEKLIPFNVGCPYDEKTHIQARLLFADDSITFDMRTWIRPRDRTLIGNGDPVYNFVREYGWSIVDLSVYRTLSDQFVTILDEITCKRGSLLEVFYVDPFNLTDSGLDHVDKIMARSPRLQNFKLLLPDLEKAGRVEKAQLLLSRYGKTLSGLQFHSNSPEKWLPHIASSFPTRNSFPNLTSFIIQSYSQSTIPSNCLTWIVTMISSPLQELELTSMGNDVGQEYPGVSGPCAPSVALRNVTLFGLYEISLDSEGWRTVIEAIDLSTLIVLSFQRSNFGEEQLKLLADRIPDNTTETVPLRTLNIGGTDVMKNTNSRASETMLATLRAKAPMIEILARYYYW